MYTVQIQFANSVDLYGVNCASDFVFRFSFYFMPKIWKYLEQIVNMIFESK